MKCNDKFQNSVFLPFFFSPSDLKNVFFKAVVCYDLVVFLYLFEYSNVMIGTQAF